MKIAVIIVRTLLGLGFVIFGLNILHPLPFIPTPTGPFPQHAVEFMTALGSTGYMKAVGVFQLVGGLLLLIGRFVPIGLVLLGPVLVNILLFHSLIMPAGIGNALVFAALYLFVWTGYRSAFAPIFKP